MSGEHIVPWRVYGLNFIAITILMFATVGVSHIELGIFNLPVALLIAIMKTSCIVLFFMNVKYCTQLVKLYAAAGFCWFIVLIVMLMSDYVGAGLGSAYTTPIP